MKQQLYRQSSIDRMNSPEQLNDYIRVANPGVWLILAAVVLLLLGALVWGIFGTVETTLDTVATTHLGSTYCYLLPEDIQKVEPGQTVRIGEIQGSVTAVPEGMVQIIQSQYSQAFQEAGLAPGDFCFAVQMDAPGLPDGTQKASLVLESIHPLKFVIQ